MLIISYERLQVQQLKLKNKCLRDSDSTLWIRSSESDILRRERLYTGC
jgi:hypothetical protein